MEVVSLEPQNRTCNYIYMIAFSYQSGINDFICTLVSVSIDLAEKHNLDLLVNRIETQQKKLLRRLEEIQKSIAYSSKLEKLEMSELMGYLQEVKEMQI